MTPQNITINVTPREAAILLYLLSKSIIRWRDNIILPARKRTVNATRHRALGQHIYLWRRIHHARKHARNN